MNIIQAIKLAEQQLIHNMVLIETRIDAEFLISHILTKSLTWLKTWPEHQLSKEQELTFLSYLKRRQLGEPIAYIIGEKAFWTLNLKTNSATLIPRADSEILVEAGLEYLQQFKQAEVLDLGTGTGAIALAIASERSLDSVVATDFSLPAVELAKQNATSHGINNVNIFQSDWFQQIPPQQFDLIVSNPPYIQENDPHLTQADLVFEPTSALVAADNGLADIKKIIANANNYLKPDGALMFEHGYQQAKDVRDLFNQYGYVQAHTKQDLAGLDRVSIGYKSH